MAKAMLKFIAPKAKLFFNKLEHRSVKWNFVELLSRRRRKKAVFQWPVALHQHTPNTLRQ